MLLYLGRPQSVLFSFIRNVGKNENNNTNTFYGLKCAL